jgi:hypothetical protein
MKYAYEPSPAQLSRSLTSAHADKLFPSLSFLCSRPPRRCRVATCPGHPRPTPAPARWVLVPLDVLYHLPLFDLISPAPLVRPAPARRRCTRRRTALPVASATADDRPSSAMNSSANTRRRDAVLRSHTAMWLTLAAPPASPAIAGLASQHWQRHSSALMFSVLPTFCLRYALSHCRATAPPSLAPGRCDLGTRDVMMVVV